MANGCDSRPLGPLPKSNRGDELEHIGIDALKSALPKARFLYRDERIDDKGVDGSLELKIDNRYTNLRSQVQLKSTDSVAVNEDGSVSLSVDTSNLNYLLNGSSPLYVLYIAPLRELRFVWAHDAWKTLDAENPEWRSQSTVTLRFVELLSGPNIESIHARIRREAQFARKFREILSRATLGEDAVIPVNTESLEVTEPDELYRVLASAGMTAVCSGYARRVLSRVGLLPAQAREEPHIHLLCAYAEHTLGKYAAAFGHLSQVALRENDLCDYDRHFFQSLRNACEFQLGRISREEYRQREATLARTASGMFLLQCQVDELSHQLVRTKDLNKCKYLLASFEELVTQILSHEDINESFKIYVRIQLLRAQGQVLIDEFCFAATTKGMRGDLGMRYDTEKDIARAAGVLRRKVEWIEQGNKIIKDAAVLEHPILYGDALLTTVSVIVAVLGQRRILAGASDAPKSMIDTQVEHIEKAIEMFAYAGALEHELRARMLRADLHEFLGETAEALKIAANVLPEAQAMDYKQIAAHAESYLTGISGWKAVEAHLTRLATQDPDVDIAKQSDEKLQEFARYVHAALELPADRLPQVVRHFQCMRDGASARLTWCRHFSIVGEDPNFAVEPERRCACLIRRHRSQIGDPDWTIILVAFQKEYCDGCADREPKSVQET